MILASALSTIALLVATVLVLRPEAVGDVPARPGAAAPLAREALLADSLAAKVTGQPGSLAGAITKITSLVEDSNEMPAQNIVFSRLFVGPLKRWPQWGPLAGYNTRRAGKDSHARILSALSGKSLAVWQVEGRMDRFTAAQKALVEERVRNLALIESGTWTAFEEVRGGIPLMGPSGWE
jgi:hypothetical protein